MAAWGKYVGLEGDPSGCHDVMGMISCKQEERSLKRCKGSAVGRCYACQCHYITHPVFPKNSWIRFTDCSPVLVMSGHPRASPKILLEQRSPPSPPHTFDRVQPMIEMIRQMHR